MVKSSPRNEFRKNKKSGHPAYIYKKIGGNYVYIGITHSDTDSLTGKKNIVLEHSPNPNDKKKTYVKNRSEYSRKTNFSKEPYKGWSFSKHDQRKVDCIKKRTK